MKVTFFSGAIWWPNLELMQMAFYLAGEITQVKRVNTLGPLCLWQCLMTIFDDNFWWQLLMTFLTIFDNLTIWQFWQFLTIWTYFWKTFKICRILSDFRKVFRFFESFQIFWKFLWPETWHLRHWLHFWQLRTTIWTITLWPLNTAFGDTFLWPFLLHYFGHY